MVSDVQEKSNDKKLGELKDPKGLYAPPIPPCEDKMYVTKPCYDFVWSGSGNKRIEKIVDAIMENNPRRKIPKRKVCIRECDISAWLSCNSRIF